MWYCCFLINTLGYWSRICFPTILVLYWNEFLFEFLNFFEFFFWIFLVSMCVDMNQGVHVMDLSEESKEAISRQDLLAGHKTYLCIHECHPITTIISENSSIHILRFHKFRLMPWFAIPIHTSTETYVWRHIVCWRHCDITIVEWVGLLSQPPCKHRIFHTNGPVWVEGFDTRHPSAPRSQVSWFTRRYRVSSWSETGPVFCELDS